MELQLLDKYELLERLGQGGMGEVWKARDTQLRRYVAIKLLHADLQANPDFVAHFMREARLVASLHHPNIVQLHDFQLTNSQASSVKAYMVMDYIEGGTLSDYMRNTVRKGLFPSAADIVYLFGAISLALDYAHQKGMIHRDIKPANILLDKPLSAGKNIGEPILTDFGIARLQGAVASTMTNALIGTPLYISPEQAAGQNIDERSDLYSLGIVLYEMLAGMTPFRANTAIAIMMQHMYEKPADPALINPRISPALSAVVLQSIAKDPKERFPTATAMTVAMARALEVPVPASLSKTAHASEASGYNPLQPFTSLPGAAPYSPALTASPPAAFTPASAVPAGPFGVHPSQPPLTPIPLTHPTPAPPAQSPRPGRKWLLVAVIACVLLVLIGVSAFSIFPLLFPAQTQNTQNTTGQVVGQIVFTSSSTAPHNTFDQLQIDLHNVSPPPASTTYYGWLEKLNSEAISPQHWPLQVQNGAVHSLYISPQHTDLLSQGDWFLITAEPANSTPVIPFTDPSKHIYYALISHTQSSSPTFKVRQCAPGGTTTSAAPCSR